MKPHETRSTGQGVGGNPESEGPQGNPVGPSESEPSPARPQGRPSPVWGKPCVAYGGRVCEAGMLVSSSHGDPGRPSALRVTDTKAGVPAGGGRYPSGAMAAVGRGGSRGRRGQGVGCGHSVCHGSIERLRVQVPPKQEPVGLAARGAAMRSNPHG